MRHGHYLNSTFDMRLRDMRKRISTMYLVTVVFINFDMGHDRFLGATWGMGFEVTGTLPLLKFDM